ncbi:MAG TPA: hypothetical protein VFW73_05155 [Lacipirellulaceae bacterium]|nr:hypothetical protein [Lacipirellulaceae bacterium]
MATLIGALTLAGCERKERVLDVQTPGTHVQVDRNKDNGNVEVKTTHNHK